MKSDWQTISVPTMHALVGWKSFIGETCPHGRQIVIVDGEYVRNHYDSDFSQGGNGFRYRFIPRGEIWIDSAIHRHEWPFVAFHECQESERMRAGLDYETAHDQSKHLEDSFRHHHPKGLTMAKKTTKTKYTKLRGKTRELASKFIAEEMETKKYPRAQAIAIGISRARTQAKKDAHRKRIHAIIAKHL